MREKKAVWIWYPGDFEIYHGMKQNFEREERGFGWPAYWKMDDWNKNVHFFRDYELSEETSFTVTGHGKGYVLLDQIKYPMNRTLSCPAGKHRIEVFIGCMTGLPCVYIEGDEIVSGPDWKVDDFRKETGVGFSSLYTKKENDPNEIVFEKMTVAPSQAENLVAADGVEGALLTFPMVVNGTLEIAAKGEKEIFPLTVCYGESKEEAMDVTWCYYKQEEIYADTKIPRRAFRFLFFPEKRAEDISCRAIHMYVPIPVRGSFHCDDELMNQIWETAMRSYCLCSGLFFIDGIKRDRWIWSGDAYQSYFVNPYVFFDREIDKRTILALRGNLGIDQHINTIVDYSMLWLISIRREYEMFGEKEFVRMIYPKMVDLMRLLMSQINELGFIYGREKDWIYVDWTEMDKEGTLAAEQVLLLECYKTMIYVEKLLGYKESGYEEAADKLKENIFTYFWDEEKGAFIDSYESGRRNVTRHANIFALLFDLVDETKKKQIIRKVLFNDEIPMITTPYFKFFELDVMGKLGYLDEVYAIIRKYWGEMVKRGAMTFWEEFDPDKTGADQYAMYGDPFGKSLCHAWGASPIYLLGRYFLGVYPTAPGYATYEVKPEYRFFKELDCMVPAGEEMVHITMDQVTREKLVSK